MCGMKTVSGLTRRTGWGRQLAKCTTTPADSSQRLHTVYLPPPPPPPPSPPLLLLLLPPLGNRGPDIVVRASKIPSDGNTKKKKKYVHVYNCTYKWTKRGFADAWFWRAATNSPLTPRRRRKGTTNGRKPFYLLTSRRQKQRFDLSISIPSRYFNRNRRFVCLDQSILYLCFTYVKFNRSLFALRLLEEVSANVYLFLLEFLKVPETFIFTYSRTSLVAPKPRSLDSSNSWRGSWHRDALCVAQRSGETLNRWDNYQGLCINQAGENTFRSV